MNHCISWLQQKPTTYYLPTNDQTNDPRTTPADLQVWAGVQRKEVQRCSRVLAVSSCGPHGPGLCSLTPTPTPTQLEVTYASIVLAGAEGGDGGGGWGPEGGGPATEGWGAQALQDLQRWV